MAATHTSSGAGYQGVKTVDSVAEAERVTLVDAAGAAVSMGALPTGAATSAKQDTGNTSLASIDTKLSGTGAVKDNGPGWTSSRGVAGATFTSADASGADAAVTDAPTAGQKIVVTDVEISVDTAMRVDLKEETSGTLWGRYYLAANSSLQVTTRGKKKLAVADKKLVVRTSAAGNIAVTATYFSEA